MLENLTTEQRNTRSTHLDQLSVHDLLQLMNDEDALVIPAIKEQLPQIASAVTAMIAARKQGGRLIYTGAGTSGRMGLIDAVECVPTFSTTPEEVMGLIAGGQQAFVRAVEGAEDDRDLGVADLKSIQLTDKDVVIGITASGRTPYVAAGLTYANELGATTVGISCNAGSLIGQLAQHPIEVVLGPEVLTGSTRLKAGTAQKIICNMLSTAVMVGSGKVYGNLMVDVQLTNEKLVERGKKIIMEATDCTYEQAAQALAQADNKPKVAIVMLLTGVTKAQALEKLTQADGFIRKTLPTTA